MCAEHRFTGIQARKEQAILLVLDHLSVRLPGGPPGGSVPCERALWTVKWAAISSELQAGVRGDIPSISFLPQN